MGYIRDRYNYLEIDSLVNQISQNVHIHSRKEYRTMRNLEVIIPCLYHRNDKSFFDTGDDKINNNDVFKKVRELEFPYCAKFKTNFGYINITIYDDFISFNKEKDSKNDYLSSFTEMSYSTSGEKIHLRVWYRPIQDN